MNTAFRTVNIQGEDILTIGTAAVGDFTKSYLGERGRQIAQRMIVDGHWQLDDGWKDAHFAAVTRNGS
ncbi:MAG: hypothetical protein JSW58_13300, partial [Candidatus Latescibacterota bacterium]